jgi:hypothetical protein
MARPKAIIDWDKAGEMIAAGCDGVQVAAFFGIKPDTLYFRCEQDNKRGFSEFLREKRASGDAAILKAQFDLALKDKNPTMLVWLGKQRLGQREKQDTDLTSGGDKLTEIKINWPHEG